MHQESFKISQKAPKILKNPKKSRRIQKHPPFEGFEITVNGKKLTEFDKDLEREILMDISMISLVTFTGFSSENKQEEEEEEEEEMTVKGIIQNCEANCNSATQISR